MACAAVTDSTTVVLVDVQEQIEKLEKRYGNREDLTVKQVKAPEGITLIRVGFFESQIAGGRGHLGGYSRKVEVVRWFSWLGEEFLGGSNSKNEAISYAEFVGKGSNR